MLTRKRTRWNMWWECLKWLLCWRILIEMMFTMQLSRVGWIWYHLYYRVECICNFIATHNRKPYVLDIGCGTGLLSLQAARAGAEHVYACEMFSGWAEIASKNVKENGFESVITVFNKHSSALSVKPSSSTSSSDEVAKYGWNKVFQN